MMWLVAPYLQTLAYFQRFKATRRSRTGKNSFTLMKKKRMVKREDILSFLSVNKEQFLAEFQVVKIGLFGSFARNEQTNDSDIDLIVEFQPNTENLSKKKAKVKELVSAQFNRKVDVCREKYIKSYFKSGILQSAIYV